jgi:hypothetical protein
MRATEELWRFSDLRDGEGGDLGRRFDERGEISVDDGTPLIVTVFNTVISCPAVIAISLLGVKLEIK